MNNAFDSNSINLLSKVAGGERQLPAQSYTDLNWYKHESEAIFERGWTSIGFASELPSPGDCLPRSVLGKPLLLTRDQSNNLNVFANVCRHRGHLLMEQPCKNNKAITCPYHRWSYNLDGGFQYAPFWDGTENSSPDSEQATNLGLVCVPFEVWFDIIFVNLSDSVETFETFIEPLNERWHPWREQRFLRPFSKKQYAIEGNWKLAAENFLDSYHLPWIHPEIGSSIESSLGLEVENLHISDNIIGFSHPTAGQDKSKTERPLPPWPNANDDIVMRQDLFYLFPNTCLVMEGNFLWSIVLLPDGTDRCNENLALYVVTDSAMEEPYAIYRQQLENTIYKINDQDTGVIKALQAGRQSDAASQCVFNDFHDQLGKWFHQRVAKLLLQVKNDSTT